METKTRHTRRARPRTTTTREKVLASATFRRTFDKALAKMENPNRKRCAHGHPIKIENADISHVRRTGRYGCNLCNKAVQARYHAKVAGTSAPKQIRLGIPEDPETALKVIVRTASLQFSKLKPQARTAFKTKLLGMLATTLGVQDMRKLAPVPVPDDFAAHRGRPYAAAA